MSIGFARPGQGGGHSGARAAAAAGGPRVVEAPRSAMRCGRCRHEYAPEAWDRLEVVDRILAVRIRGLVTAWPDDVSVEIRRCVSCGGAMARTRSRS
jgi:hypothetical protein